MYYNEDHEIDIMSMEKPFNEVLVNGEWIEYGICSENKDIDPMFYKGSYIGESNTSRHNRGNLQVWDESKHYWRKKGL